MKKYLLLIIIFIFGCAYNSSTGTKISFTGQNIQDEKSGLFIVPDSKSKFLVVANAYYHYIIALPYSKEWVFSLDDSYHLKGNAGVFKLTFEILNTDISPKEYLLEHKRFLMVPGSTHGLEIADVIEFKGNFLLRTEVNAEKAVIESGAWKGNEFKGFRGVKHVNYFSARRFNDFLYVVHLSTVIDPQNPSRFKDDDFKHCVTVGYKINFNI